MRTVYSSLKYCTAYCTSTSTTQPRITRTNVSEVKSMWYSAEFSLVPVVMEISQAVQMVRIFHQVRIN